MTIFKDKTAIVTGGAEGVGQALCQLLGQHGAIVVVADIDAAGAEQVAGSITASGGRASAARLDVSNGDLVCQLVQSTVEGHGQLDFMFNNAGLGITGDVRHMTPDHWRRIIDINLWGVIHGSTAAYSVMATQGFGHIVNSASLAGLVPVPTTIPYTTAKHAVVGLSRSLRLVAAESGVKVSVVCAGPIRTRFYESIVVADGSRTGSQTPAGAMDAHQAARAILQGVARNRQMIIFPFRARLTWLLYRFLPVVVTRTARNMVRRLKHA